MFVSPVLTLKMHRRQFQIMFLYSASYVEAQWTIGPRSPVTWIASKFLVNVTNKWFPIGRRVCTSWTTRMTHALPRERIRRNTEQKQYSSRVFTYHLNCSFQNTVRRNSLTTNRIWKRMILARNNRWHKDRTLIWI